jgi:hypothetical protein
MHLNSQWTRFVYILGIVSLLIGVIDPMEGSVLVLAGSAAITFSTFLNKDAYFKIFLVSFIMIAFGVFFLFYLSSIGGFAGGSSLSWWMGLLILPYPVGWLLTITMIILKTLKKNKVQNIGFK